MMNKLIVGKNSSREIYIDNKDSKIEIVIEEGGNARIYHYVIDKSFDVEIYLKGENARVDYFYSIVSNNDNYFNIKVYHEKDNTTSNLVNHGVNTLKNKLQFRVDGIIPKARVNCLCNQDNKIMNLDDGDSTIEPNLLIDSYDSVANHSAYIGKFRDEVLFYLNSRGISKEMATRMLTLGFLVHDNPKESEIEDFLKYIEKLS